MASLTLVEENDYDKLVLGNTQLDRLCLIDKAVGKIAHGQVLALDISTGKLVNYDPAVEGAKGVFTVYTGQTLADVPTADFIGTTACFGTRVDKSKLVGIELTTDFEGQHKLYLAGILLEEVK
jgi:hypothetical protein